MEETTEILNKLHAVQLEMVLEIKRICEKHGIQYFLLAGTLLGAVRHKGFIPWDDDLDIGMLRQEYEKFLSIAGADLQPQYFLQSRKTDVACPYVYAKLRKKGTQFISSYTSEKSVYTGIFIDIFPFDNVPVGTLDRKFHSFMTQTLIYIQMIKFGTKINEGSDKIKTSKYYLMKILSAPFTFRQITNMLNHQMVRYNSRRSDYIVNIGGSYGYAKETLKKEWAVNLGTIGFEGHDFSCPSDFASYLTHLYGDYMTPPPENKRFNRHKVVHIELGE